MDHTGAEVVEERRWLMCHTGAEVFHASRLSGGVSNSRRIGGVLCDTLERRHLMSHAGAVAFLDSRRSGGF